jgi:hypothetical protein
MYHRSTNAETSTSKHLDRRYHFDVATLMQMMNHLKIDVSIVVLVVLQQE